LKGTKFNVNLKDIKNINIICIKDIKFSVNLKETKLIYFNKNWD